MRGMTGIPAIRMGMRGINIFQIKIRKVTNAIKENDVNNEIEIVLPSVIHRDDQDLGDEISKLNKKLENLCKGKGMRFIDNSRKFFSK